MANNYPENLLYTKEHEWCRVEGDVATIGITWHAQSSLGDVVFCDLPAVGATLTQGSTFGVVESVKAVSDLYAPLSGTVVERNDAVVNEPGVLNTDAYEAGWMLKVKLSSPDEVKNLLSQKDYLALLESAA
ncbi:glycine cleavage system protein GcvH [Myxococcota bacterium]|nr:glycine cleavage system protein GcvH [Myxococcota bacterium]